jgi:hypothetical protein
VVAVEHGCRPPLFGNPSLNKLVLKCRTFDVEQVLAHFVAVPF